MVAWCLCLEMVGWHSDRHYPTSETGGGCHDEDSVKERKGIINNATAFFSIQPFKLQNVMREREKRERDLTIKTGDAE